MAFKVLNRLCVSPVDNSKWELINKFKVSVNQKIYTIPKGFKFDFASTPRLLWVFFPPATGSYRIPALLHDYMYSGHVKDRKYADRVFLYFMRYMKVNHVKAYIMWLGVRIFGYFHFTPKSI